jgi:hypothetical protein
VSNGEALRNRIGNPFHFDPMSCNGHEYVLPSSTADEKTAENALRQRRRKTLALARIPLGQKDSQSSLEREIPHERYMWIDKGEIGPEELEWCR